MVPTMKLTPLLVTPPTVTVTLPVFAPLGTGTTMLVALQLVGVAAVPLNITVLDPCVPPKFVPVIVTDTPTGPELGLRFVMFGDGITPLLAALNAAKPAAQKSAAPRDALAAAAPEFACIWSSAISLVLGSVGTRSSMLYPEPAVKVAGSPVIMAPSSKSSSEVVTALPL